jgi:hypothetical protein
MLEPRLILPQVKAKLPPVKCTKRRLPSFGAKPFLFVQKAASRTRN